MILHPQKNRQLRVLHCHKVVGGNSTYVSQAERAAGADSRVIALNVPPEFDATFTADATILSRTSDSILKRELQRAHLLWKACIWADVIHFSYGHSIFPWEWEFLQRRSGLTSKGYALYAKLLGKWDIRLLKALGKKLFVTYQGDDARQGDYCRKHFAINFATETDAFSIASDESRRRKIAVFDRYADGIYSLNPDLLHVLPKRAKFVPYGHVDLRDWKLVPLREEGPIRIGHAPSNRVVKGTRHIIEAVEKLRAEGLQFEFVLIENILRGEARKLYEELDIVVDQVLAGWYGGLATEFMAMGRPAIAYIREGDLKYLPPGMADDLAVINAGPSEIKEVLHRWICADRETLLQKGLESRLYTEKYHDPNRIAQFWLTDYLESFKE